MRKKYLIILIIFVIVAVPVLFFYLTTLTASPKPVTIVASQSEASEIDKNSPHTINLWLLSADKIYAYKGGDHETGKNYNYKEVRNFLSGEKKQAGENLAVIIKKTKYSSYQNAVDILDEMTINNIKKYTLLETSKQEEKLAETLNQKH